MEHGLVTYFQQQRGGAGLSDLHGIRMWSPELGDFTCDTSKEAKLIRTGMTEVARALCESMAAKMPEYTGSGVGLSRRERSRTPTISAT